MTCIESCDSTDSCMVASYISGTCTLLSSITDIVNEDGAEAAFKAAYANSALPSLESSVASSVLASATENALPPSETTNTLPYDNQMGAYLSARLSRNTPTTTGAATAVYVPTTVTSPGKRNVAALEDAVSSSSTAEATPKAIISLVSLEKKAATASSSSLTCVASRIALIKLNETSPASWCQNWLAT